MSHRIPCNRCGISILEQTATRYNGSCRHCFFHPQETPLLDILRTSVVWLLFPLVLMFAGLRRIGNQLAAWLPGTRANLLARLKRQRPVSWSAVVRMWRSAPAVYGGPIGYGAELTPEFLAIRAIASDSGVESAELRQAMQRGNATLAAYCMLALRERDERIDPTILSDKARERILHRCGCFAAEPTLAEYCRLLGNR